MMDVKRKLKWNHGVFLKEVLLLGLILCVLRELDLFSNSTINYVINAETSFPIHL